MVFSFDVRAIWGSDCQFDVHMYNYENIFLVGQKHILPYQSYLWWGICPTCPLYVPTSWTDVDPHNTVHPYCGRIKTYLYVIMQKCYDAKATSGPSAMVVMGS